MMKKLLILMLVLGVANVASAVIGYDPVATDIGGGDWSIDIVARDTGTTATHLIGTGELLISIVGNATITDVSALTYAPTQAIWDPAFGLLHQEIIAGGGKSGQFGASSTGVTTLFWMTMPDSPQGNIIVTLVSGTATVTLAPNNVANAFGNTLYYDGTSAIIDLNTTGGSVVIPEPMTIGLLGLGGLFLRRRKK